MPWLKLPFETRRLSDSAIHALVFLSGACGLLYEVTWHRYLSILLGSHARATSLVLAIFLGGLAVGYGLFGRWCARDATRNWLKMYALVEALLGAWALLFPTLYRGLFGLTGQLYATLGVNSLAIDLFIGTLLIGPPTLLMGGTLPLLTQALSPSLSDASRAHARIYGSNTVGAGLGALLTGYWLVPRLGLEGTLLFGAAANALIAAAFWFGFSRSLGAPAPTPARGAKGKAAAAAPSGKTEARDQWLIVTVGFLSGFYVLTLETVLIRLMGLATGASGYNFSLIVSVFVFALGAGSLWARGIDAFRPAQLFWNQALVAALLFALYLAGDYWPWAVHVMRAGLRDIAPNFPVYQFRLAMSAALVLAVPIGLCGLTLPLCFHLLKNSRDKLGWSVGWLYGINTVGAVAGALIGGYWLLHPFDLDEVFKICVWLAAVSACVAGPIAFGRRLEWNGSTVAGSLLVAGVMIATGIAPRYTKENYIQPFRRQLPIEDVTFVGPAEFTRHLKRSTTYLHYEDDPNTSVGIGTSAFEGKEFSRTIFINGKSDGNTRGDLFTTVMLGHIPGMLGRNLSNAAVIGFGTGMTVGVLSLYPEIKQIDVLEISPAVIKNAHYFDRYNGNVTKSGKVQFHEMDAMRYFVGDSRKFDLIVSEPSNPWVAGVENLYASEFYQLAKSRLNDDGMFVQWIHTYSFTDDLLKMVLRTITLHFPHVSVFQLKGGDLALVAKLWETTDADLARAQKRWSTDIPARNTMVTYGVPQLETLLALEVVPDALTRPLAAAAPIHTLERPRLSNEAALAFFANDSAKVGELRRSSDAYLTSVASSLLSRLAGPKGLSLPLVQSFKRSFCDDPIAQVKELCDEATTMANILDPKFQAQTGSERDLASFQVRTEGFSEADLRANYGMLEVLKRHYSPIVQVPIGRIRARIETCLKGAGSQSTVRGECLLQKTLLFQLLKDNDVGHRETIVAYRKWFKALSPSFSGYAKFKEADDILTRLLQ